MRLLERETPLSTLLGYAEEARDGHGRMVLVAGEAGVGKSSLVDCFHESVGPERWYQGACDGLFTPRPLAPVVDIAEQTGGELARLCGEGVCGEPLFAALLRFVTASDTLTVLVMEDIHWADEATLDVLRFLGRRIRDARVVLLVTYRDEGLTPDHPLRITLGDLSTHLSTRRMTLAPLSEAAVGILAAEAGVDPTGVYALTAGNPFFVTEVVHVSHDGLPPSVRDAVLARVSGLGSDTRRVLETAALIGSRVDVGLLRDVTGATGAVVDELVACGVVSAETWVLRFRHEIARIAIQSCVGPHRARAAHIAILDALVTGGCEDDARLAFHADCAGDGTRVLEFATRAARQAALLGAHREAIAQFDRALAWSSCGEPRRVADLYDGLAQELSLVERWQESADAVEQSLELWRHIGDQLREGDALRRLSRITWQMVRGDQAEQASLEAVRVLDPLGPTPELSEALANLALQRTVNGDNDEAFELTRRARAMAEEFGLPRVVTDTLITESLVAPALKRDWEAPLRQALEVARSAGLVNEAAYALCCFYDFYHGFLRWPEAEEAFHDAMAYCEDHDLTTFANHLLGERSVQLQQVGRWNESVDLASGLLYTNDPSPYHRISPLMSVGVVQARRSGPNPWPWLDEALELARRVRSVQAVVEVRTARAEAYWLEQSIDAATLELEEAVDSLHHDPVGSSWITLWRYRISGRNDGGDLPEPFASEVVGKHRHAAELWDALGLRYHAAVALMREEDEAPLRDALRWLDDLGATATAGLTRRKMRRLGVRTIPSGGRSSTRQHPARLTSREHEVLVHVCDGLTNDEISRQLFVAVKTVDHHVSAILAKLGVANRKAAAREAIRLGLVGGQDGKFGSRSE